VTSPNSATITKLIKTAANRNRIAFIIAFWKDTQSRLGLRDSGDFDELGRCVDEKRVAVTFSLLSWDSATFSTQLKPQGGEISDF
jgi:hypothetical protein